MIRIALFAFALCSLAAEPAQAQSWRTYTNARFGTIADVPRDWKAGREPENGDGLQFTSPDGQAAITVSGMLNIDDTIDAAMKSREEPDEGETVTYKVRQGRMVVVSGLNGNRIFYRKSLLSCRDQIWNNISIEYPAARKSAYDALVTHVASTLRFGQSAQIPDCK